MVHAGGKVGTVCTAVSILQKKAYFWVFLCVLVPRNIWKIRTER